MPVCMNSSPHTKRCLARRSEIINADNLSTAHFSKMIVNYCAAVTIIVTSVQRSFRDGDFCCSRRIKAPTAAADDDEERRPPAAARRAEKQRAHTHTLTQAPGQAALESPHRLNRPVPAQRSSPQTASRPRASRVSSVPRPAGARSTPGGARLSDEPTQPPAGRSGIGAGVAAARTDVAATSTARCRRERSARIRAWG